MKKILLVLLNLLFFPCLVQAVPVYAEFVGGLNIDNIKLCNIKLKDECSGILKEDEDNKSSQGQADIEAKKKKMMEYASCMRQKMGNEGVCSQNLALLNKLQPNFVEVVNILHYPLFDAVETMVNKDNKQKWYFIVNHFGEFIDTRDVYSNMKDSTTYPYLIRKYPNAVLGDMLLDFSWRFEKLSLGEMRLVSARSVINRINDCIECEVIGTMEDGYDFKPNGTFKWVKFIKLIPNVPL